MLIAHTTDLSTDDEVAFVHAVALARAGGAKLVSVHACVSPPPEAHFRDARPLLERWSARPGAVIHETIIHQCCDEPADTLLDALGALKPDLVVSATHARSGVGRLLVDSVAEEVARNATTLTLLFPLSARGFIDMKTGALSLDTLLVPAGSVWEAAAGVDAALWLARLGGKEDPTIVTLHVDDGKPPPHPSVPTGVTVERWAARGSMDDVIVQAARDLKPSLVVMPTHGHDGLADVMFGSHTERALHRCQLPMLWIPLMAR